MMTSTSTPRALQALGMRGALVTGASSGIGRQLALQLAASGVPVAALARNEARLQALAEEQPGITPLAVDLRDETAWRSMPERLSAAGVPINAVFHNAAVQHDVELLDARYGLAEMQEELVVNLMAPAVLTRLLLPSLLGHPKSWIVMIGSGLAFAPKPRAAVYSATKAGLRLFGEALRLQLHGTNARVVEAVMPLVDTPMTEGRGRSKLSARAAAAAVLQGIEQQKSHLYIGRARALPWLKRWAPGVLKRLMRNG